MSAAKKVSPIFYVSEYKGDVHLSFWSGESALYISLELTESEARRLAASLLAQADKLPRVASAADLGLMDEAA